MKYHLGPYCWASKLSVVASYITVLGLLLTLGFWQLDRAEQKRLLLTQQMQAQSGPVFNLNDSAVYAQSWRYTRVTVSGKYDQDQQFLIDNQVLNRRVGYFVMTPFMPDHQQQAVLVNRGWLPADYDRSKLPDVAIKNIHAEITGRINNFPSVGIKLADAEISTPGWPSVVQVVDSQKLAAKLKYPLHSFQLQLDASLGDGYHRVWTSAIQTMPPEKHTVYAVQWFSFALLLTVFFIAWTVTKEKHGSKTNT